MAEPPTVTEMDLGGIPDAGASEPIVLAMARTTLLGFEAVSADGQSGFALAEFANCLASKFGYPNDEALAGHPLYRHGLGFYGVHEVTNSPWLAEIDEMNRRSFPAHGSYPKRHFVVSMHDNTFEALSNRIELNFIENTGQETLRMHICRRLAHAQM